MVPPPLPELVDLLDVIMMQELLDAESGVCVLASYFSPKPLAFRRTHLVSSVLIEIESSLLNDHAVTARASKLTAWQCNYA